jgi:hypothetical protein
MTATSTRVFCPLRKPNSFQQRHAVVTSAWEDALVCSDLARFEFARGPGRGFFLPGAGILQRRLTGTTRAPDNTPMFRPALRRPLGLQLLLHCVMLAIVVNTLLPTFLRGAATGGAALVELCSAGGMRWIEGTPSHPPDDSHTVSHTAHCALCSASVDPLLPALAAPATHWLTAGRAYLPPLFSQAPRTLFIWATSQARAPPAPASRPT